MSNTESMSSRVNLCLTTILIVSFLIAYLPVWKNLIGAWLESDQYSHGFFILPLCIYMVWRKKGVLVEISVQPSLWGFAIVILSSLAYVFSYFAEIVTLASISMVVLLIGVIIYLYGFLILKELAFPVFFLLFMIPAPTEIYSSLTIPLQLFVSKTSVWIAAHIGVPVYREGNVIHLPDRTMQVVQACSGLRSMVSLLALSAIISYLTLKTTFLRALLFLSGVPAAIFVNVVRVLLLTVAFHYFNWDLTTGSTHVIFGMCIFLLALLLVLCMKGVLSNWDRHTNAG